MQPACQCRDSASLYIFLFSGSLPSTTLYYKACTKHFPVLLCTTKLAQTTSQYYFVLQSLHKVLPSTTLYYKACTKPSQYYFVLQSLHKLLPSTTLYYKACTKHFPVLLCTTKLAQTTSQYYFVLQTDMTTCLETYEKERFCSFPHRHGIHDATTTRRRPEDDTTPTRRRRDEPLEANKGPAPRPPDYKREPFARHSGKIG